MIFSSKIDYNLLAKICLHADGGYCTSCACDVAKGFCKAFSSINYDLLEKEIYKEYKAWDFKENSNFYPIIEVVE